jgi:hypothetical protein
MLTVDRLNTLFYEVDGVLFWKEDKRNNPVKDKEAGYLFRDGYKRVKVDGKIYTIHRLIFFKHYGYFPVEIDHINNNKLDNRITNLREVTRCQNQWNRPVKRNSTTGVKGVYPHFRGKFSAEIRQSGTKHYLGLFNTVEEAAKAVQQKREELHCGFVNHG